MQQTTATSIPVRKPKLDFAQPIERYYLGGSPIRSHIFNALNLLFPEGERFFVRSVHEHAHLIDDAVLLREIRAFAGQEGQHAHQHERFFEVLEAQGYKLSPVMRPFGKLVRFSKRIPRSVRLAMTAGAEHYTASMASELLDLDMLNETDPVMRKLITWHALEEIEHKHVAYDVLMKVYPNNYPLRILGFVMTTALIFGFATAGLRMFVRQDYRAGRLTLEQIKAARAAAFAGPKEAAYRSNVNKALLRYFVPGFHPNQHDDGPLLRRMQPQVDSGLAA